MIRSLCKFFLFLISILYATEFSADPTTGSEIKDRRMVSTANPAYYCLREDAGRETDLLEIASYGYVDIAVIIEFVTRKADELSLHPTISRLFFDTLVPYFTANPYVGSRASGADRPSAGWFGGFSVVTLVALNYIMREQDGLPEGQKMKFLGVGSGNALFEFLLSHIGPAFAMDVFYPEKADDASVQYQDSARLRMMRTSQSFFMPVTVKESRGAGDDARIVAETFPDANYADTVLVLSWPRDFAIPYIHTFLKKGGRAVLFIRNEAVPSIFHESHLGEIRPDLPNFAFKKYLVKFNQLFLPLNTATFSAIDLYYKKGIIKPPIANAIEVVKARLGK